MVVAAAAARQWREWGSCGGDFFKHKLRREQLLQGAPAVAVAAERE